MKRRSAGFSLLEVLVATGLSLTALLLASQLLLESEARLDHAVRRALDPPAALARAWLRADLRAASGVLAPMTSGWSREALELLDHPAGAVRYLKQEGELMRELAAGGESSRRSVLDGVTTWRWRIVDGSVEVDLGFRETARLERLVAAGRREAPVPVEQRRLVRVTPRQGGGRRW